MSWQPLLRLSRSDKVLDLLGAIPADRPTVARFVAGETPDRAVEIARGLADAGMLAGIDWLVDDAGSVEEADATAAGYLDLLEALRSASVAADVTLRPGALGLRSSEPGAKVALENARAICLAAKMASSSVTVDVVDAAALDLVQELRRDYPDTGLAVRSAHVGAEAGVGKLTDARVRLVSGVVGPDVDELTADKLFVRCTQTLMEGSGRPGLATHDSRLIRIAAELARRAGRDPASYEFVLPYGVRADEARRLAEAGETVRVVLPFGVRWAPYVATRLAEHPANLASSVRSLVPRRKARS